MFKLINTSKILHNNNLFHYISRNCINNNRIISPKFNLFSTKKDDSNKNQSTAEYVNLIFINKDNTEKQVKAKIGDHILQVAHQNDIDLEGACEASLACSTCHVILESKLYEKLSLPKAEEEDLLDLAYGLTETSRLGCQVIVTPEFEGCKIRLPKATRNFYVDGHKPKPHQGRNQVSLD